MTRLFFSLTLFLILSSCYNVNKSDSDIPEILLSKSQMIEILTEVQLTEAGFNIKNNRSKANELKPKYYDKILQHYGITLQQLKDNINYYQDSPKIMEEIYESVLANLSKIQSDVILENEEIEKKRVADSIKVITDSLIQIKADSLVVEEAI